MWHYLFCACHALCRQTVTARYPRVHGAPVHFGDPSAIGKIAIICDECLNYFTSMCVAYDLVCYSVLVIRHRRPSAARLWWRSGSAHMQHYWLSLWYGYGGGGRRWGGARVLGVWSHATGGGHGEQVGQSDSVQHWPLITVMRLMCSDLCVHVMIFTLIHCTDRAFVSRMPLDICSCWI